MTDANLMLGRIQPDHFPMVFGPSGDLPLDAGIARERFTSLAREIEATTGDRRSGDQMAAGFLQIAVANMANAVKKISVQRGYDVTKYVLATFGGAGGQHACAIADALGMSRVLIHPLAGLLSAYGMGLADVIAMRESAVEAPLSPELTEDLGQMSPRVLLAAGLALAAQPAGGGFVGRDREIRQPEPVELELDVDHLRDQERVVHRLRQLPV